MHKAIPTTLVACRLGRSAATPASAQVAAEEAIILSGGSGQASTQKRLGDAISGSFDAASGALRSTGSAASPRTNSSRNSGYTEPLPQGDPLENTDAKAYQVQGGARIKLSGSFRPSRTTSCTQNCPAAPAQAVEPEAKAEEVEAAQPE